MTYRWRIALCFEPMSIVECRVTQSIFRATPAVPRPHVAARATLRAPGNLPYLIDNLWEWLRPDGYPCRRTAAFASPTPDLAAASQGSADPFISSVVLPRGWRVAQLTAGEERHDAKHHRDVAALRKAVMNALGQDWLALPSQQKGSESLLFVPCLQKDEVQSIVETSELLSAELIRDASTFWRDIALTEFPSIADDIGEIFFDVPPDGYRLESIEAAASA